MKQIYIKDIPAYEYDSSGESLIGHNVRVIREREHTYLVAAPDESFTWVVHKHKDMIEEYKNDYRKGYENNNKTETK